MDKAIARTKALELRKKEDNIKASNEVLEAIIKSKCLEKYNKIGIYYPIGKEINITDLLTIYPNKEFYFPKTTDVLEFIKCDSISNLIPGPFKTKEPSGIAASRDEIECFIIPCVAISFNKRRVGYGKGYYDKYLSGYKGYKIGVCYNSAYMDINTDEYDVKFDEIFLGWLAWTV